MGKGVIMKYELTGKLPDNGNSAAAPAPIPMAAPVPDGLDKYRKMLKMSVPKAAIVNKMTQDKIDSAVIQKFELTGKFAGSSNAAPIPAPAPTPNGMAAAP